MDQANEGDQLVLTIRQAQFRVLQDAALADFLGRLEQHLLAVVSGGETWAAGRMGGEVRAGLACGRQCKILSEKGIARLTELVVTHLGGFANEPLSKSMLNVLLAHGRTEAERLEDLEKLLMSGARP